MIFPIFAFFLATTTLAGDLAGPDAGCTQNFDSKKTSGFNCSAISPGSMYEKLGLKSGDVITEINNKKIKDSAEAFLSLQKLQEAEKVDIRVKRQGRYKNLHYRR